MKKATKDLTTGNLYRNFLLFAIPLVLASMLSQAFGTIDTIIAGRFIGDSALAATSAASSFHSLFNALFYGFFTGIGIYAAHLFGAGRYQELKTTTYSIFLLSALVLLAFSGVAILLRGPLFRFLKVDPVIYDDAMKYFIIVTCAKLSTLGSSLGLFILHAMGNTVLPLWMSLLSSVINLAGNIFTVVVLHWGVMGIALSTVVAGLVVFVAYLFIIRACFRQLLAGEESGNTRFRFDFGSVRHALRYSVPTSMQQMILSGCTFGLAPLVNGMGYSATAGYSIAGKTFEICQSFYLSSSRTVSNYVAQCTGGGQYGKISKGMRVGFLQGALFLSMPLLLFTLLPKEVCGLFFSSGYEGVALDIAVRFCRVFLPFVIVNMFNNQFHAFFRGFGAMKMLVISTSVGALSRLALSYLFIGSMAMDGIYLAWVLSWGIEVVFSFVVYLTSYRNEKQLRARHICL